MVIEHFRKTRQLFFAQMGLVILASTLTAHAEVCTFNGVNYTYEQGVQPPPVGPTLRDTPDTNTTQNRASVVFPQGVPTPDFSFGADARITRQAHDHGETVYVSAVATTLPTTCASAPGATGVCQSAVTPLPVAPTTAAQVQAACQFRVWNTVFSPVNISGNNGKALVVVYGSQAAIESATFWYTQSADDTPTTSFTPSLSPDIAGVLQSVKNAASAFQAGSFVNQPYYLKRYFALEIPIGQSSTPRFIFASSKQGRIYYKVFMEVRASTTQVRETALRSITFRPKLRFTNPPLQASEVNTCAHTGVLQALNVQVTDGNGNVTPVLPNGPNGENFSVTVNFQASPAFIFKDQSCLFGASTMGMKNPPDPTPAAPAAPPNFPSSSEFRFYFKTNTAGEFPITVSHTNSPIFRVTQNQIAASKPPIAIDLTGPASVNQAQCSSAFTAKLFDSFGNQAPTTVLTGAKTLQILFGGAAVAYSDASCTAAIASSQLSYPIGTSTKSFYVKSPNAGPIQVSVLDPATSGPALQRDDHLLRVLSLGLIGIPSNPEVATQIARRMHERLVGVPPASGSTLLANMSSLLMQGRALEAAHLATLQNQFYDITLRNMVTPLSNRTFNPLYALNDFVTTWIGTVRDDRSAQELLTGDVIYAPAADVPQPGSQSCANQRIYQNNAAFNELALTSGSIAQQLVAAPQCTYNAPNNFNISTPTILESKARAGLLTTRAWAGAHLYMGTNRRGVEFALDVFLCKTMFEVADSTTPDYRIRRDVDRAPAGNPAEYQSNCRSCHGGLDGLSGAYAFFDFYPGPNQDPDPTSSTSDARVFYAPSGYVTDSKMNINQDVFPAGWLTQDDTWINFFVDNRNQDLGWAPTVPLADSGMKSLGRMLAHSDAFPKCMAKRVFKEICRRDVRDGDSAVITDLKDDFIASGYSMRRLFTRAGSLQGCVGVGE
jgi:hypothetical protein